MDESNIGAGALSAVELAAELTAAWLGNPNTRTSAEDVPAFLAKMHETVTRWEAGGVAAEPQPADEGKYAPAVSVRKSLSSPDHIISDDRRQAVQDTAPPSIHQRAHARAVS